MNHNPLETLSFDLQVFAENEPDPPVNQPLDPGQQVIEDGEESSIIFEPGAANEPGNQKDPPDPGTPQGPQAPDSSTPAPQYEIDGIQFNAEDVKRWSESDKGKGQNEENWKANLNRRGQELNDREATLKQRETITETNQNLLAEYQQFKSVVDANADARKYFEQLVKDPQSAMQPALKKIQDKIDARFDALDVKDADIKLTRDFKDYDPEVCEKALAGFDPDDPYDVNKLKYFAWKGMNLEAEIQKRIASGQVNKGPALPPLADGTPQKQIPRHKNIHEATDALMTKLGLTP